MNKLWKYMLVAVVLGFIWGHSMMPKSTSITESSWVMDRLNAVLAGLLGKELTLHLVRKLAHLAEYALLAFVASFPITALKKWVNSFYFCFSVAFIDETIQMFSDRGDLISDVWVDLAGVLLGSLAGLVLWALIRAFRKKKPQHA